MSPKVCPECGWEYEKTEFRKSDFVKNNGHQSRKRTCDTCVNEKKDLQRKIIRLWYYEFMMGKTCKTCGQTDTRTLCWHHRDESTKKHDVSTMISHGFMIPTILKEIEKCVCLCSNCHSILHDQEKRGQAIERNWDDVRREKAIRQVFEKETPAHQMLSSYQKILDEALRKLKRYGGYKQKCQIEFKFPAQ